MKWHVFKNHFSRSKVFDDLPSCLPVALVAHKKDKIGKDGGLTNMWNKSNGSKLHHHHHDESMVLKWQEVPEKVFLSHVATHGHTKSMHFCVQHQASPLPNV